MILQIADVNYAEKGQLIHGASAEINVYNPKVEPSQFTNAQIWINGGPNENPNYIMAGWTDRNTGDWWLAIKDDKTLVGYWPKSLFSYLADGANSVSWGGLAKADSNGVSPPMGSGLFSKDYYSCFNHWMKIVNGDYNVTNPLAHPTRTSIRIRMDSANCFDIRYHDYALTSGTNIQFGGPGGAICT
ncbi:hypothetical protein NE237_022680 [Protea cynaroides]|uniref:Neprosin PEP catalytic domain-containing protein n=1 Tax=Protea cynaroides TaxID=273540 RepID=A0A9Q0HCH1_9MAGN|nr:hypothetical protein NE237_022680 [Protea cynaroides]